MRRPQFTVRPGDDGPTIQIHNRGLRVLDDPQTNRGTAFTPADREHLGLHGLLPPMVEQLEAQAARCYAQYGELGSDVEKWLFLTQLHDTNEVLFYRLVAAAGAGLHALGDRRKDARPGLRLPGARRPALGQRPEAPAGLLGRCVARDLPSADRAGHARLTPSSDHPFGARQHRPDAFRMHAMRTACGALTIVLLALVLGACGESSEEKAQSTVCDARADIGTQVDKLKALTPATITTDAVTQSLDAIKQDLQDIGGAQSDLSDDRRSEVEAANKAFTSSVQAIAGDVVTLALRRGRQVLARHRVAAARRGLREGVHAGGLQLTPD